MEKTIPQEEKNFSKVIEITDKIYWVGMKQQNIPLGCNPYLIVDNDEAVLFDPGSVLDFDSVFQNVSSLLPLEKIKLIVTHHQDPDLCSALPLFYKAGLTVPIALHWRTSIIIPYYGVQNNLYIVNENGWEWSFRSGRRLRFLPAPYCHFPGSIMTYDEKTKTLFSGDLFGALSRFSELFADESYRELMLTFHEHYMPSHDILMPVMDSLLQLNIDRIAPQHGCIIQDNVRSYILDLRNLTCGSFLGAVADEKGNTLQNETLFLLLNSLLTRLTKLYSEEAVRKTFLDTPFILQKTNVKIKNIKINDTTENIINIFLEQIIKINTIRWITVIEPFLFSLLDEYHLPVPSSIYTYNRLRGTHTGDDAAVYLPVQRIKNTEATILHDSLTGLYNETVFSQFLENFPEGIITNLYAILYFSIDNLTEINRIHGRKTGDETLRLFSYVLKNNAKEYPSFTLFKLNSPFLACIAEKTKHDDIQKFIDQVKTTLEDSKYSAERLNVSTGILYSDQIKMPELNRFSYIDGILRVRIIQAQKKGPGGVCDSLDQENENMYLGKKILLLEPDDTYIRFLKPFFDSKGYYLQISRSGSELINFEAGEFPDLIIAEAMSPSISGFELRNRLLSIPEGQSIPFILLSRRKDEEFIKRAAFLGILHFLKKPFSKNELFGLVDNLLR